ncbi:uncharacterized protein LOC124363091 isoform X4 [Homalodisca vitripennis]|uniref:uncharacterized protein LOC124363091 isoform X4 n=1 Tax=Homalodisca vitripennis TaxID=197043 RepID=UPI001EEAC8B7|nr:uncharacterized protein LOC124363091 isoform X4 [Homalodisca vitripennis]
MTNLGFYLFVFFLFLDGTLTQQRRSNKNSQASSTSASQVVDFDCPEEFGYYPHPADCTQYYVCVFGGALLESCTGGLMYSHELQTCDWPRNVGCGELVSTVSSAKAQEPRLRQPQQQQHLRSQQHRDQQQQQRDQQQQQRDQHQHDQRQQQNEQRQQQPVQQFPPQRLLQRDEAIPKHHLYTEEDLGPAEEVESDRQQRVYRGQPATLGQVARDRDGLSRHSNALQVAPGNGREKLSVISFGTQQQYSRQSIAPPYIEPTTTRVTARGYNATQQQQQQYTPSPYDPYYNIYEDEADLYKDIDYSQYSGQQNQQYQKQSPVVQQQVQATPSRKPSVQYSPPPPQQSYNAVQQDVYSQSVGAQDYSDNYNLQDEDIDYKQSDIDLKSNRGNSRNRGSATYTVSPNEAEPAAPVNRGTPASISRNRPTLKPSTSVVSKASEYVDIYRYPPSRPEPIYPTPQVDKTAAKCRKDVCLLPDCSCGGKEIPGDLPPEQTPQIVLLTFDDSVNDLNKGLYSDLFEKGRTNPNGCPIAATFYVSHEWTDYSQVQNLYAGGHEIASHSVSHSFGEQFSVKKWTREIAGQREILSAYGGVRQEDIRGMRAPFLAVGGNKMFKMLYDSNFTYDSSMPVYENKPPSWPYTLDYKIFHDCMIPPCPTRSYPGVWEVPMVMWQDLNGGRCSMGDACSNPPTADGVYKMLVKNFERHFTSNRSPFGLFYHAAWFTQPHHKEGFIAFLDTITKMPEVWLLTNWQAIQWVRDPTPISRLNSFAPFQCNYPERPRRCNNPKVCNLWHKSGVRYMRTCQPCPDIYPWTGKTGVRNSRVDNEIITE